MEFALFERCPTIQALQSEENTNCLSAERQVYRTPVAPPTGICPQSEPEALADCQPPNRLTPQAHSVIADATGKLSISTCSLLTQSYMFSRNRGTNSMFHRSLELKSLSVCGRGRKRRSSSAMSSCNSTPIASASEVLPKRDLLTLNVSSLEFVAENVGENWSGTVGGDLYFTGRGILGGSGNGQDRELWILEAGTTVPRRLADIRPFEAGSNPGNYIVAGENVFFSAKSSGSVGLHVWKNNALFTLSTASIDGGIRLLGNANGQLYFYRNNVDGAEVSDEIWKTDGTVEGTIRIRSLLPETGQLLGESARQRDDRPIVHGDGLYFRISTNGGHVPDSIVLRLDLQTGEVIEVSGSFPTLNNIVKFGSMLAIVKGTDTFVPGAELAILRPGSSTFEPLAYLSRGFTDLVEFKGRLYFTARGQKR